MSKSTLVLAAALLGAGCGGTTPEPRNPDMTLGEAAAESVVVVVRNNWIPVVTVQVFSQAVGGRRRLLGTVQANAEQTFVFSARDVPTGFTLVAQRRPGEEVTSRLIRETAGWQHRWNMATNIIRSERMP
jgi:hypothetical protein